MTRIGNAVGLTAASDGTLYIAQQGDGRHKVRALSLEGHLTDIAGQGSAGYSGDNGPALLAEFFEPSGLALDEGLDTLYVADTGNNVIRAIERSGDKRVTTVAGGGLAGDGSLAILASLDSPSHIAVTTDGSLLVAEPQRIRKVDGTTGFISTWLANQPAPAPGDCAGPTLVDCGDGCPIATDGDNVYVAGTWACVTPSEDTQSPAYPMLVKIAPDGLKTPLVGSPSGTLDDVSGGLNAQLPVVFALTFDGVGSLYFSDDRQRVRRWNIIADTVETLAGAALTGATTGTSGFTGDYGPATDGLLDEPRGLALLPNGNLAIADSANAAVRFVWDAAQLCVPSSTYCDGPDVRICDADGRGASVEAICGEGQACADGPTGAACADTVCVPYMPSCNGEIWTTCNPTGSGYAAQGTDCSLIGQVCAAGVGCIDAICDPEELFCDGNDIKLCNGNGSDATLQTTCPSDQFCNETTNGAECVGICVPSTCADLNVTCGDHSDGCGGIINCDALCVPYANGSVACAGGTTCEYLCNTGYHVCDGAESPFCADDTSPDNCGTSCTPCNTPANGVATCNSGSCGVSCSVGFTACNDSICVDTSTDADHCGGCNSFCPGGCLDGSCIPVYTLEVVVGDQQTGVIDDLVAVPLQLKLTDSGAPAAFVDIAFEAPPGAAIDPPVGQTNTSGIAFASARLGREPGVYTFTARVLTAPQVEVDFTATAVAPADETIFSLVNWEHVSGDTSPPSPGTTARVGAPQDVVVASDGTVFFSDVLSQSHKVRVLTPEGELIDIAGVSGSGDFGGDYGSALAANLDTPRGLALDETNGILYIADSRNDRVRAVDLSNGIIATVAGGGSAVGPGYGDGGLAAFPPNGGANIATPTHLTFGPDGNLYLTDSGHDRIRRVDPNANTIDAFVSSVGTTFKCNGQVVLTDCSVGCAMVWSPTNVMFLSGKFACGETEATVNQAVPGIVRVEADGSLFHVAGKRNGSGGNNIPAQSATLGAIEGLAIDPAGNLVISEANTVRVIDAAIGRMTTWSGQDLAGSLGDFGPAADAELSGPRGLAFWGRHLLIADTGSFSIRTIWNVGATVASQAQLEIAGGDGQTAFVDQQLAAPLSARITDGAGDTLPGVPVSFQALVEGGAVVAPRSPAAANGVASIAARPGLVAGTYDFEASFRDIYGTPVIGSPVNFSAVGVEPNVGTLLTAVNTDGVPGDGRVPAPGTLTRIGNIIGIAVASDGTTYFTQSGPNRHRVRALSAAGELTNIAGIGSAGFSGDNGPALLAEFNMPYGLALDETLQVLYLADALNDVVRAIELTGQKRITTYVGGGVPDPDNDYGDGGLAIFAALDTPTHLALASDGSLFITDEGHGWIRRVAGDTTFITTPLRAVVSSTDCLGAPLLRDCDATCALEVDASDELHVIGNWGCTGSTDTTASTASPAIVRMAPGGVLTHLVGIPTGSPADIVSGGLNALIGAGAGLAIDGAGVIYFADDQHRVRRWDPALDVVSTITGQFDIETATGISGFFGDYGPAVNGAVSNPSEIAIGPTGHVIFADYDNAALRIVWELATP